MLRVHPNLGYDMTATAGGHNIYAEVMRQPELDRRGGTPQRLSTQDTNATTCRDAEFLLPEGISQIGHRCTRRGRDSRSAIARSRRLQPVPYLSAKILTGRGSQKLCRESAVCEERRHAR